MQSSFNLVQQDWIPVRESNGRRTVGLAELFSRAHEIDDLELVSPLAWVAVFRLLLAICHRALNGPKDRAEWRRLYELSRFPDSIQTYLEQWSSRFDLFDEEQPFGQDISLRAKASSTVAGLIPQAASGNNGTLFDHSSDEVKMLLSPSEACLALLTIQSYGQEVLSAATRARVPRLLERLSPADLFLSSKGVVYGRRFFLTLLITIQLKTSRSKLTRCWRTADATVRLGKWTIDLQQNASHMASAIT